MKMTLVLLLLVCPAMAQDDGDLAAMAENVGDYRTKFRLINVGLPALKHLMPQAASEDKKLAFESRSAIRWIVGHSKEHKKVAHHLVRHFCGGNNPVAVRVLCTELLADLDRQTTVGMLSAMISSDEEVGLAAIAALRRMSGTAASDALVSNLKAARGKRKSAIYRALGARRDKRVLSVLWDAADAGNASAIAALGDFGSDKPSALLRDLATKGSKTAFLALMKIARNHPHVLIDAQKAAGNEAQVRLWIDTAGRYGGTNGPADAGGMNTAVIDQLSKYTEKETYRTDANHALLTIMENLPVDTARPFVRSILEQAKENSVIVRALAGCGRCKDAQAVSLVVKYVDHKQGNVRTTAIAALTDIDGAAATDALIATLARAAEPATQKMLMQALAKRGDPRAAAPLEEWMKPGEGDPSLRQAAVNAYVAIAHVCDDALARAMYRKALAAGATAEAIDGLAEVGDASDLDLFAKLLEGDQKTAATRAVIGIAERSKGADAIKAYVLALNAGAMVENELRLLGEPVEITARAGRVGAWWIKGPFPAPKVEDWKKAEAPEKSVDLKDGWRPVQVGGKNAIVSFDALLKPNDNVTAYAFAEIWVRKDRDAQLKCGSDDGIRVWVNGELVHSKLVLRGLTVDEDSVDIKLKKGRNTLLVKVCEKGGGWEFHVRLRDQKGRPLKFKIK